MLLAAEDRGNRRLQDRVRVTLEGALHLAALSHRIVAPAGAETRSMAGVAILSTVTYSHKVGTPFKLKLGCVMF